MIQWHPLFVQLLRPVVEDYYEIETNVAVGDVPREADVVLLRRTQKAKPPFEVLWKYLTAWNILEYKGPSVSAQVNDLRLLMELGLGIHRKVNPLQFLHAQPPDWDRAAAKLLLADPALQMSCGSLMPVLHPGLFKEIVAMVRTKSKWPDLEPLVELMGGMEAVIKKLGINRVIDEVGVKRVIDKVGVKRVIDEVGVKRVIDEVGVKRVIDEVGVKRVIDEVGLDTLLANLSPAQRRVLKRRLGENPTR